MTENLPTLIVEGAARRVAYAVDAAGRCQAREFLFGEAPDKDRNRILHTCRVLAEQGRVANPTAFKKEVGEIWALKSFQARVGAFLVGKTWFLTHGFIKKADAWPRSEIERAERIRLEHLARSP
jgi:hypothetical protein